MRYLLITLLTLFSVNAYADKEIFLETFTGTTADLTTVIPDVGNNWTEDVDTCTGVYNRISGRAQTGADYANCILMYGTNPRPFESFPMTKILDNFNRANEADIAGINWTKEDGTGTIELSSNQIKLINTNFATYMWNTPMPSDDHEVYATIPTEGNARVELYLRFDFSGTNFNGYRAQFDTNTNSILIEKRDPTSTILASGSFTFNNGDVVGFRAIGDSFILYVNGVPRLMGVDTQFTGVNQRTIGITIGVNTTIRVDDFGGGGIRVPFYIVQGSVIDVSTVAATDIQGIYGRWLNSSNYYTLGAPDDAGVAYRFYKRVANVSSSLGTGGTFGNNQTDVLTLIMKDEEKRAFENNALIISTTDNAILGRGKAGIWCGQAQVTNDDCDTTGLRMDNFSVTEIRKQNVLTFMEYLVPNAVAQETRNGRWYVSPVIKVNDVRMPKIETIPDPGKPMIETEDDEGNPIRVPLYCNTSNVIGNSDIPNEWALSYVKCMDYSALDADPEIIKMYNETDGVDLRLNQLSTSDRNSLRTKVNTKKTRNSTLTNSDTVRKWIEDLGKEINPQFNVDGTYAR
jgi:hypothetical protein